MQDSIQKIIKAKWLVAYLKQVQGHEFKPQYSQRGKKDITEKEQFGFTKNPYRKPGVMVHICNPSMQED
jgi:hypothetical protein